MDPGQDVAAMRAEQAAIAEIARSFDPEAKVLGAATPPASLNVAVATSICLHQFATFDCHPFDRRLQESAAMVDAEHRYANRFAKR